MNARSQRTCRHYKWLVVYLLSFSVYLLYFTPDKLLEQRECEIPWHRAAYVQIFSR